MRPLLLAALLLSPFAAQAQDAAAPVADFLFLGSYHMDNPGRDVHNTRADDVLAEKRQREIDEVVRLVERYRPTRVMIETDAGAQARVDAEFDASCHGDRPLDGDEREQLGYRIACDLGLPGVVAVDWNDLGPIADENGVDYLAAIERAGQQEERARHMEIGRRNAARSQQVLDNGTIGDMLLHLNSDGWLEANARAYFHIGLYGTAGDPAGANWMMLWFGRDQRIFNNIVRHTEPGDRVLVIYGAGHGNLLRQLAEDSGFYRVHDATHWLDPTAEPSALDAAAR
jgi:hypothetical protein